MAKISAHGHNKLASIVVEYTCEGIDNPVRSRYVIRSDGQILKGSSFLENKIFDKTKKEWRHDGLKLWKKFKNKPTREIIQGFFDKVKQAYPNVVKEEISI